MVGTFCVKHHLPENHDCPGLKEYKARQHGAIIYIPGREQVYRSQESEIPSYEIKVRVGRPRRLRQRRKKSLTTIIALVLLFFIILCLVTDFDEDGLSNLKEIIIKTNPLSPDTDHDNMSDKE